MAVLFDPADEYVASVLDLARVGGTITLAELESIIEAGLEARKEITADDVSDTIEALRPSGHRNRQWAVSGARRCRVSARTKGI